MKYSHAISASAIILATAITSPIIFAGTIQSKSKQTVAQTAATSTGTSQAHKQSAKYNENIKAVKTIESEFRKVERTENSGYPISNDEFNRIIAQGVSKKALTVALNAYQWAIHQGEVGNKRYLTVVDFSLPSTARRMNVIDLKRGKVVYSEMVSQGIGSGRGQMATRFSDQDGSHASVLGTIVTSNTYYGKHGYSLQLNGLEGINKNIRGRAIVVHSANYATPEFARANNRLGNSWGCFAIDPSVSKKVINTIKGGSVIYAYAPQMNHRGYYA